MPTSEAPAQMRLDFRRQGVIPTNIRCSRRDQRAACFCYTGFPSAPIPDDGARCASPTARSSRAGLVEHRTHGGLPSAVGVARFAPAPVRYSAPLRLCFTCAVPDRRPKPHSDPAVRSMASALAPAVEHSQQILQPLIGREPAQPVQKLGQLLRFSGDSAGPWADG